MKKVLFIMMLITSLSFGQESKTKSFEETLVPYVEKTLSSLEKGVEFASKEIPEILMQYVVFEAVSSWLMILFAFTLLTIGYKIGKWLRNKGKEISVNNSYAAIDWFIGGTCTWISTSIIFLVMFFIQIEIAIKATFFPKLFLVERFIELI